MNKLKMSGRKWEIFESAVYLFAKHGYGSVSMRGIAAKNEIRAASLYNHFPSKESLLETMYEFYRVNIEEIAPTLEGILAQVPVCQPKALLSQCMSYMDEELQPLMDCIYMIAMMEAYHDEKAYEVIWSHNIEYSEMFLGTVLRALIEAGRIESLDIESFTLLFTSLGQAAVLRNRSAHPVEMNGWLSALDMLFSVVKEIPRSSEVG